MFPRLLKMDLPTKQSAFLWGPRKTGKSTFLRKNYPNSIYFDLLDYRVFDRLNKDPGLLRQEVNLALKEYSEPIIIDEVQKIPHLLDQVHLMMEQDKRQFILCGSSARKLKRGQANLLGGRAWRYILCPLASSEIRNFDLLKSLKVGLLPSHYTSPDPDRSLEAYVLDYLKEEIQAEALTRNLRAFSSFLDAAAYSQCELVNYSNIASDCGVDNKTVKNYFQILEDTLIGEMIYPLKKSQKRKDLVSTGKFYFFDVGIARFLSKNDFSAITGSAAGKAFEHLIYMELKSYNIYHNKRWAIQFWRTHSGLEVDFIVADGRLAFEVKIGKNIKNKDLKGLQQYLSENSNSHGYVVSAHEKASRTLELQNGIEIIILSWKDFSLKLWQGKLE